ncbi:TIGR01777 family oxidoreductase [Myroides pelagicus]|uniref:TIGR01777 family protein n=1 Tax=Myroides pelagicus TaxID=270914 RepID=A0A7K1GK70_9FLAO|nr:TIGR01777 family oxidoreductase [Myroides pelagicus]MEC4114714.1 TIGR01777 family oxidoreductase [Myroides pelagicus]MTH29267.1 TIGR01777 family protein [Myroides pelagicus]
MKILVTGATGFIGKRLVSHLLKQGHTIHFLSTSKRKLATQKNNVRGYYWNIATGEIDVSAFDAVDIIIHLAGANIAGSWSKLGKQAIIDSRVQSSKLLYNTLKRIKHNVSQVICSSAIGIYANTDEVQSEDQFTLATNFLGEVVQQWEKANTQLSELGIGVTLLRIGLVLDSQEGALPKMAMPIRWGMGSVLGSGKQVYSWVHIDDLVGLFYYLMINRKEGIYNAVAPEAVSNRVFTMTLGQVLHRPIFLPTIPGWLIRLGLGEKSCLVLEGQRVSSHKVESEGYQFIYSNLVDALEDIYSQ